MKSSHISRLQSRARQRRFALIRHAADLSQSCRFGIEKNPPGHAKKPEKAVTKPVIAPPTRPASRPSRVA